MRRAVFFVSLVSAVAVLAWAAAGDKGGRPMTTNPLTPEEERIILHRGTEPPFSGKYDQHFEGGLYLCKRCGVALYRSESKFNSGCGWPAFDEEIRGAVERRPDPDGRRTEIVCARCGGHLGHVFTGEKLTPKDTRHCVNSLSLDFVPQEHVGRAVFAGGCFWGVEYHFSREPGVLLATSGYIGGHTERPSYREVCSHTTGHAEAVEVLFDRRKTSFETLSRLFFEIHDPTQVDRQGPDVGEQYRSAIFLVEPEQEAVAKKLIRILEQQGLKVATRLEPAATFWPAEDYHQDYFEKQGASPSCHVRTRRF
ncbi:MAG: bifunctional methionine sulfoxide reductase B/A protein [Myxococcales bacterium]|nr:bifunctional methionine sulfoxide reductase B/A protein [Myxococcales bacterium]